MERLLNFYFSRIKKFDSAKKSNPEIENSGVPILVNCTIPKGSEIIFDQTGLLVSNKIMIFKPVFISEEKPGFYDSSFKEYEDWLKTKI